MGAARNAFINAEHGCLQACPTVCLEHSHPGLAMHARVVLRTFVRTLTQLILLSTDAVPRGLHIGKL